MLHISLPRCNRNAEKKIIECITHRCHRRSVIAVLALTAGAAAFVAPQHPITGKALRAAAIEEEPAAPVPDGQSCNCSDL